eukprot:15121122-Heterocapsa_arctica.AAC.1
MPWILSRAPLRSFTKLPAAACPASSCTPMLSRISERAREALVGAAKGLARPTGEQCPEGLLAVGGCDVLLEVVQGGLE